MNTFDAKAYWESVRQRFNEHVKPRLDAVVVYGDLPKLEKTGDGSWKACCPFHDDSSPSLSINTKTLQYHCFGCNEGGDVVKYISKKHNVKAKEAFAILAEKAGLDRDICLPTQTKVPVRDIAVKERVEEIRKSGIEKEIIVEKTRWKALHDELNGLPHRVDMLHAAASRVAEMYALKVRELGRVSDFANMVEGLVAEKTHSEVADGLAVRRFAFELPGGKTARFTYACEFEGDEIKKIRERTTIEQVVPGKMNPEILLSSSKVFDPKSGWKDLEEDKSISTREQKIQAKEPLSYEKNIHEDPIQAVVYYSEKAKLASAATFEMDESVTKILAKEVSRAQELMLQLPDAELQRVAKILENRGNQERWNFVIKLPQDKEISIEHAIHEDKGRMGRFISEEITLPNGTKEKRIIDCNSLSNTEKQALFEKVETVNREFQKNLFGESAEARRARGYLNERGFTDEEIKQHGFGLATGREIYRLLKDNESEKDDYIRAGLARINKSGELKPVFFERITIPIASMDGNVVAFAARKLDDSASNIPKYINSPESSLFSKKDVLFGLNNAREEIVRAKNVYVVEGYFDAIAMQKSGIKNTVATMGTSLTKEHVTLLKNMSPDVTLIFDSDEAGKKALSRSKKMFEKDVRLNVVEGFTEKDPAAQIEKHGKENLTGMIEKNRKVVSVPVEGILESL